MDHEKMDQVDGRLPDQKVLQINRRHFLKLSSITILGAFVSTKTNLFRSLTVHSRLLQSNQDEIEKALKIALNSTLYQEAGLELESLSHQFTPEFPFVTGFYEYDDLSGIILRNKSSTNPRTGADMVMTFNLEKETLNSLEIAIGWCLLGSLEISRVFFDANAPLYEELRSGRIHYEDPPRMIRPRTEQYVSFVRPDPPEVRPEDLVVEGWPVETLDSDYWYYDGCTFADWTVKDDGAFLRCAQVTEHRSKDKSDERVIDLR